MNKIALDFSTSVVGGGKRYLDEFIGYLTQNPSLAKNIVLFVPEGNISKIPGLKVIQFKPGGMLVKFFKENFIIPLYGKFLGCKIQYCIADRIPILPVLKYVALINNANLYIDSDYEDRFIGKLRIKILKIFAKYTFIRAEKIIFVSESIKNLACNFYNNHSPPQFKIIPHGTEFHKVSGSYEGNFQKEFGKYILSVSSVYFYKNFEDLIIAFARIDKNQIDKLVIAGRIIEYKYYSKLLQMIKFLQLQDRVVFLHEVHDTKMLKALYEQAEIYCTPSKLESFGHTPYEALALGVPVITSDIDVFKEHFTQLTNQSARLYQTGNEEDLFNNLMETLNNNQDKAPISIRNKMRLWSTCFEETLSFIDNEMPKYENRLASKKTNSVKLKENYLQEHQSDL